MSGTGTQNAALAISGYAPSYDGGKSETELYDGAAFSEVADVITARGNHATAGTQNSALLIGGYSHPGYVRNTECWNGSSWSEAGQFVQTGVIGNHSGGGTSNAAWMSGGNAASPIGDVSTTEHWDGISWSAEGNLNTARYRLGGTGDQKSALVFGGYQTSPCLLYTSPSPRDRG